MGVWVHQECLLPTIPGFHLGTCCCYGCCPYLQLHPICSEYGGDTRKMQCHHVTSGIVRAWMGRYPRRYSGHATHGMLINRKHELHVF